MYVKCIYQLFVISMTAHEGPEDSRYGFNRQRFRALCAAFTARRCRR
jgi:hypothetical protein